MSSGYLLDTNVPSELIRPSPDSRVAAWVIAHDDLHVSVVSLGELRRGISLLPQSRRRSQLEHWFVEGLLPLFTGRVLPVTEAVADRWGILSAECQLRGRQLQLADGLIASTALQADLTVVTRNVSDFAGLGVTVLNPWDWQAATEEVLR